MQYLGDFPEDATVYMPFNTFSSDDPQASVTITNLVDADIKVHKDGSATQIVTDGATIAIDFDTVTGNHLITIDTSAHADYSVGSDYLVRIEGTTVDAGTINAFIGSFSIENRFNEVDVVKWLGTAVATPTVAGVPEVDQTHLLGVAAKMFPQYLGPDGPGVYLDSGAANTNTTLGVDGTEDNPVSTFAAARTIADSLGVKVYYLEGNSDLTLGATHVDWEFIGLGSISDNTVNLGSQDVSRSLFRNLTIEGTQGGTGRITARDCALQDPGAGATTLHIFAERCGLVDDISVDTSNDNVFDQCFSLVAGTGAPILRATGASGTIAVRHYSGGMEFATLSASHNVTWEGIGQVIFNADCNVNASVSIRGIGSLTDNTGGMASLTQTAFMNMDKVNTEADTAISDASLATAAALATVDSNVDAILIDTADMQPRVAAIEVDTNELQGDWTNAGRLDTILDELTTQGDTNETKLDTIDNFLDTEVAAILALLDDPRTEPGQGAPPVNPDLATKIDYLYKAWRNKATQTATTYSLYDDAGTTVDQKATVSDDGTTATKGEIATGP